MTIRTRVLLSLAIVWGLFFIVTYSYSGFFLFRSLLYFEKQRVNQDFSRITEALQQYQDSLMTYTRDWSEWDDAYRFMQGNYPQFVSNNIKLRTFLNANINWVTYWNNRHQLILAKAINTTQKKYTFFDKTALTHPYFASITSMTTQHNEKSGYILTKNGIMILAISPITDANEKNPPLGYTVFGRLLSPAIIHQIAKTTQLNLVLWLPNQIAHYPLLKKIMAQLTQAANHTLIEHETDKLLHGYLLLYDLNQQPIGIIQLNSPRIIYLSGLKAIHYYSATLIIFGILFSLLMLWLLTLLLKQRAKHEEKLIHLAHHDYLTELPNRFFFHETLLKNLSQAQRQHKMLAILYIDLDNFKKINDALGHATGDLVLQHIANQLTQQLRAGDTLARIGGDEFALLLNDIANAEFAGSVAEKLMKACIQPITIKGHECVLSASIGICVYPKDATSLENLLKNADMAMYQAKRAGKNAFHYYVESLNFIAHKRIQWEAALRQGIAKQEFVLYYQPKIYLKNNSLAGVEVLVRWKHPELGLISPDQFIPLAEETGLILPLGEWILREACQKAQAWTKKGYPLTRIAVNLSAKQLNQPHIMDIFDRIFIETGFDPNYLEFEITETAIIHDMDNTINILNAIKKLGITISIDDFGAGYTSIRYLKKFQINTLKVDQLFIKGLPNALDDIAITCAVISLAHNLQMNVIAEGVETEEQLAFLKQHHCDMAQGYYFSPPLSEIDLLLFFKKISY